MGKKHEKICVLAMALKPCIGGHGRWKSSEEWKTVRYSPRKWAENTIFGDSPQTLYRWSRSLEIVPGTEKCAL
jgi:hypothetical protein